MQKDTKQGKLIVGMVVYNEAHRMKAWLDAHPFFTDIIVVDQSSTDNLEEVVSTDPRVKLVKTNRFECIAEPDFKLLQILSQGNALLILSPDEFMPIECYNNMCSTLTTAFNKHQIFNFYIARRNFIDDVDVSDLYYTAGQAIPEDWQMRLTLDGKLRFSNSPHYSPEVGSAWAYMDADKVYIEHRKTLEEEKQSVMKRSINLSHRGKAKDANYMQHLLVKLNDK